MQLRWFGQSAFLLTGGARVFIDPFGPMEGLAARGVSWAYPPIRDVEADLLLVTHEHVDHNGVEAVGGDPAVVRSLAGTHATPLGEVVGVASEHDDVAGTARGHNVMMRFALDGLVVCHLGDLGQPALRPEQAAAIGPVDVLVVPAGGGPTIGGEAAARVARELRPRLVLPMHHRTAAIDFLEPPDAFLDALGAEVTRVGSDRIEVEEHLGRAEAPRAVVLDPPLD
jgi:L-ascorbate metabolism protein UlaG (beta-lactamase superfamily)